jgi:capsule polysaccharide export protein KpsE/RkpR
MGSNAGASQVSGLVGLRTTGALYVSVLNSRTIGERLVERFELRKVYRVRRLELACEELATKSEIADDRKSGIITIRVTDKTPQRAAALANGYVEELNRLLTELNTTSAHRERVFLEQRLAEVKSDVEQAEPDPLGGISGRTLQLGAGVSAKEKTGQTELPGSGCQTARDRWA